MERTNKGRKSKNMKKSAPETKDLGFGTFKRRIKKLLIAAVLKKKSGQKIQTTVDEVRGL